MQEWQNRPLKECYPFVFVDCMYVTLRKNYETKKYAVYTIPGYDIDGKKDIPGLWLNETESRHSWMQIFDELKGRGVEDKFFLSMDGVSGLESGAKAIFKEKVRAAFEVKKKNGMYFAAFAPYGYQKDPENKGKLIVDGQEAEIVKHMFCLASIGYGSRKIRNICVQRLPCSPLFLKISYNDVTKVCDTNKLEKRLLWNRREQAYENIDCGR